MKRREIKPGDAFRYVGDPARRYVAVPKPDLAHLPELRRVSAFPDPEGHIWSWTSSGGLGENTVELLPWPAHMPRFWENPATPGPVISTYNRKCTACAAPAYMGFRTVERTCAPGCKGIIPDAR